MIPVNDNSIDRDAPLRLEQAVKIAFPQGGATVSTLRTEIRKGNLIPETIAGKQFVTLRAIDDMRKRCRDRAHARASGSANLNNATASLSDDPCGSSSTADGISPRDALAEKLGRLSEPSPPTSPGNTRRRAATAR